MNTTADNTTETAGPKAVLATAGPSDLTTTLVVWLAIVSIVLGSLVVVVVYLNRRIRIVTEQLDEVTSQVANLPKTAPVLPKREKEVVTLETVQGAAALIMRVTELEGDLVVAVGQIDEHNIRLELLDRPTAFLDVSSRLSRRGSAEPCPPSRSPRNESFASPVLVTIPAAPEPTSPTNIYKGIVQHFFAKSVAEGTPTSIGYIHALRAAASTERLLPPPMPLWGYVRYYEGTAVVYRKRCLTYVSAGEKNHRGCFMLSTAKEVKAQNGGCAEIIDGRDVTSLGVIHLPNGKHAVFIDEKGGSSNIAKRTVMIIDAMLPLAVSWVSWLGDVFSDVFTVMSEASDGTTVPVYQPGADALAPIRRREDDL